MPALAPRVLKNAAAVDVTFNVSTFDGRKAVFVNQGARFSESQVLSEVTRPAAANNEGHKLTATLAQPHPVVDQTGCCVNKDTPPASYFTINTLVSKFATAAQRDDFVAELRSYVASAPFAALVKGESNY